MFRNSESRRAAYLVVIAAVLLCEGARGQAPLKVTFLDVGQGDAVLLQSPEGKTAMVDAGPGEDLRSRLSKLGVNRIDLLVASHAHADHIGGMLQLVEGVRMAFFMDNGLPYTTETYLTLMRGIRDRPDISYLRPVSRTIELGSARIRVLPIPDGVTDQNNGSVGLVVEYGRFVVFLSGDSETGELTWWLARGDVSAVTVLKAPHHGSTNGLTQAFLQAARPQLVVISVGPNSYGHPMPDAVAAYTAVAAQVLRTDLNGDVTVLGYSDGHYSIQTGRQGEIGSPHSVPTRYRGEQRPTPLTAGPPSPDPTSTSSSRVTLWVFADAPGNDHQNLNGEYVVVSSGVTADMSLANWTLCDAAQHCFRFPEGAVLKGSGKIILYTGSGVSDGVRFFMGSRAAVWNNDGDTATLYDASGKVVTQYVY